MEVVTDFIFLGSKITDFASLTTIIKLKDTFLGRKVVTNLDSLLKSRDITLPTKIWIIKLWFFQ